MREPETVVVVGVPVDENSSFMRGAAAAPRHIREALHSGSTNLCAEDGVDLRTDPRWRDAGDLGSAEEQPSFDRIEVHLDGLLGQGAAVIALGGDHSITIPLVRAHARAHAGLSILRLNAHPDLYDELDGSPVSHACPFARIMEEELAVRMLVDPTGNR